jgi:adenosylhomocysteinase
LPGQARLLKARVHRRTKLENQVYEIPHEVDQEIARLKLHAMGISIDYLTEEQKKYLTSWQEGT